MKSILHPLQEVGKDVQAQVRGLYISTFSGPSELRADLLLFREVYVVFYRTSFAAFVVFNGPILMYLAVVTTGRGDGTGAMVVRAALDRCKSKEYPRMLLECKPSLIGYYQRFKGYEPNPGKVTYYDGLPYHRLTIDID
jgi:hypothetical protein